MESLEGQFLAASPQLLDPNFVHTVVLLIEHNSMGALGVVVNRPTSKTVAELWRQVGEAECENFAPVHLGGPVSGPLMAVHMVEDLAEMEIVPGLFFAAKKHNLDNLVRHDVKFKVFVGHAGWGPGQLESEIEQGAWQVMAVSPQDVFGDEQILWKKLRGRAEAAALPVMLGIKHVPPDPSLN